MGESSRDSGVGPRFAVDDDLSPLVAEALRSFGFSIDTVARALGKSGVKDEELIPWLGRTQTAWITHDKKAKKRHGLLLKTSRVTVLWVSGDKLSNWEQFKIVVRVIDAMCEKVKKSRGAIHCRAGRKGRPTPQILWAEKAEDRPKGGHEE